MTDSTASDHATGGVLTLILDEDQVAEVTKNCVKLFTDLMNDADEDRALANIVATSFMIYESFKSEAPVACGKGCSLCCYQPVGVNLAEARTIALHIATLPDDIKKDTLKRLKKQSNMTTKKLLNIDDEGGKGANNINKNLPCAFLHQDGSCRIYEIRPLSCRRYTSHSLEVCQKMFDGDTTVHPSMIPLYAVVAKIIKHAVFVALGKIAMEEENKVIADEYVMAQTVYKIVKARNIA